MCLFPIFHPIKPKLSHGPQKKLVHQEEIYEKIWGYTSNRHDISVALDPHGMLK